ncbi:Uncharacterized protein TCM_041196 [Theobroma cacao]|uniref:Uncharacterized protein n=1 Tax=Theobroma cacao TaxID=3641 RepID=A0A061GV20_THECC|nr:Uncharacterized protein TCM_041196 [Theobroma cacao]
MPKPFIRFILPVMILLVATTKRTISPKPNNPENTFGTRGKLASRSSLNLCGRGVSMIYCALSFLPWRVWCLPCWVGGGAFLDALRKDPLGERDHFWDMSSIGVLIL